MTSEPVILLPDATVAEALALVRNPDLTPALAAQVFVVRPPQATPTGRFLGTAHIQHLLREPPSALVSGVADVDLEPLAADASLADVTRYFATYNLVAAPVVDENDRLLGAVERRRPARPPAARGLARPRRRAAGRDRRRPRSRPCLSAEPASTSPRRRVAPYDRSTTPRRSAGSPNGWPGSWAPVDTCRPDRS